MADVTYLEPNERMPDHSNDEPWLTREASFHHGRDEYVSKLDPTVHTNTVEGFFSIFKRGMRGVYHGAPEA